MPFHITKEQTIAILVALLVGVLALTWVYLGKPGFSAYQATISHRFTGAAQSGATTEYVDAVGGFTADNQKDTMGGGTTTVRIRLTGQTQIIRTAITLDAPAGTSGYGFSKPLDTNNKTTATATVQQFLSDLTTGNLVLVADASNNIYGVKAFNASTIRYTILITK